VLNTRAHCSGMFRSVLIEDRVKVIQWLVGAWAEVYIAQSCRWKGSRSLNCPETRWREIEDSQQSWRVTTCTTGEACLTKTSTERTTKSRRHPMRPGGEVSCESEEVQLSQRLSDCVEAGLRQLTSNRLSESISLLFCSL